MPGTARTVGFLLLAIAGIYLAIRLSTSLEGVSPVLLAGLGSASIVLSTLAFCLAWLADRRSRRLEGELARFTRSVEQAMSAFDAYRSRDAATIGEMNALMAREIGTIAARREEREGLPEAAASTLGANVVAHPANRRRRASADAEPGDEVAALLADAVTAQRIDLSLQPIISVSDGAAAGFETFCHLQRASGASIDVRRFREPVPGLDLAVFERLMFASAVEAGRRQLGTSSERMPLHVAVSDALIGDQDELGTVLDLLRLHPRIANSVVVSLPVALAMSGGGLARGLDALTEAGIRLAVEDGESVLPPAEALSGRGIAFMKVAADRLLDRERARRRAASGAPALEIARAASIPIVATEVGNDEDALGLLDLGVDLMTGERFSGPKRLKPEGSGRTRRMALV